MFVIFQHANRLSFLLHVSGEDLFQIRGQNGLLHSCMDPLPEVSGKQEVADTADHVLETFYPVSPTIDLQKVNIYQEEVNCSGEEKTSAASFIFYNIKSCSVYFNVHFFLGEV